ncbi:uncharacterized protein LOC129767542 isoform X3 [Toxorhynchites rutilus septentrionalis]|uniref:uncharacterized protein LOC129767542 isoform X3 n=1 Tax=Toxorhynchites rutilus septentrionalis TaxID=329112 RepID=UPI002479BDD8|nr:uncharacterized protein LOC129767542 isoform X3 [Toxorhynchites rutilus septentrionalis]
MRDLPKTTTQVVKKASDIFVPGEQVLHLYGSSHRKPQPPAKVVGSARYNHLSEGIKASPARQSLVSEPTSSSTTEEEDEQAFNVDEVSEEEEEEGEEEEEEISSPSSSASEIEVGDDDEGGTSGRQEASVDDESHSPTVMKKNGRTEQHTMTDESKIPRLRKHRGTKQQDDSTCCNEDFTWVNSRTQAPKASIESDRRSTSHTTVGSRSTRGYLGSHETSTKAGPHQGPALPTTAVAGFGKPPRPMTGSLDRRRHHHGASRQERDSKSRSTHSLKEKSSSSELHKQDSQSSNLSLNSKGKASSKRVTHGKGQNDKLWIFEEHQHDSGNFNNYNSSGSSHHINHSHNSRQSPGIWEPPPPPPISHWDPHYYWNWNHQSREELRMIDYHRRQQEAAYRYGSNGALSSSQDMSCSSGCCNRGGYYQPPPPPCCSCEHSRMMWGKDCQRQDTDERLRRLQSDKEALALQVKVLTEQVQTQSTKLAELERTVGEKNQLLSNAEDLLQRVSEFARTVGIHIDKQKEMLSRSSLETQKLELMSAMSELKLQQAALERENLELRSSLVNGTPLNNGNLNGGLNLNNNASNIITASSLLRRTGTPVGSGGRIITSTPGNSLNTSPLHHGSHGNLPQTAGSTTTSPVTPKTPPASYRQRVDLHYSSLPRQAFATTLSTASGSSGSSTGNGLTSTTDSNANLKRNVAFADTETLSSSDRTDGQTSQRSYTPQPSPSPSLSHKNLKGLRNIFGKIKRSNSGTLEDISPEGGVGEFRRGGIRATAGARLCWSSEFRRPDKPFQEWDIEALCQWFEQMGLNMYEEDLRRWLKGGGAADLVKASPVDIEKELNLKNPLHRKKIVLAVADLTDSEENDALLKVAGKLDTSWTIRWLDDVGLPQHKDSFSAARMDGRMLHKLTMDDLISLHVTSCLHVASIRRGIQIMREQKWNPESIIRRSITDESCGTKDDIRLWSSHRVMEWLRAVDLSEYAPNLRGAGVHGALLIYEVKFTAELLAELLSIPPSKTLLRRHLATHFKELLGRDVIQSKRDAENTLGFQPLTLAAKIKTPKKSQFSLKRKKSSKGLTGDEWSDYVCPMVDSGQEQQPTQQPQQSSHPSQSASAASSTVDVTTTTSATSATNRHHSHNSHASNASPYSANTNHVTSNAMAATMKTHGSTLPDSSTSSSSISTVTTSAVGSEVASHQQLLSNVSNNNSNSNTGSDSPTSTRSSTTSTS